MDYPQFGLSLAQLSRSMSILLFIIDLLFLPTSWVFFWLFRTQMFCFCSFLSNGWVVSRRHSVCRSVRPSILNVSTWNSTQISTQNSSQILAQNEIQISAQNETQNSAQKESFSTWQNFSTKFGVNFVLEFGCKFVMKFVSNFVLKLCVKFCAEICVEFFVEILAHNLTKIYDCQGK